jgi:hypothetical protein
MKINAKQRYRALPGRIAYIIISLLATFWFLIRVIPKPSRAAYPCMRVAAPIMSGFIMWILTLSGSALAFRKAGKKLYEARHLAAILFLAAGIATLTLGTLGNPDRAGARDLETWYRPNVPLGVARGIFPGRVAWGHSPGIASWDGETAFWWEDRFNDQEGTGRLLARTLTALTGEQDEREAWDALFTHFNRVEHNREGGYAPGEKIAVKINMNNTSSHSDNNQINANPQLVLCLLESLVHIAGVPQENITVADPSRFITDNIFDKCHAAFPGVIFVDHVGGDGRTKATFQENGFIYSYDFEGMTRGLATCFTEADYVINMALMKGHVGQGVTLNSKNFFGCLDIETDWRKNTHCSGFSQSREGKRQYSVFPDFMGHKDLGGKTMLFLIDGIYGNKFVEGVPGSRWALEPFGNLWPQCLFASQDGVAIESVVLDFALAEWPDAPEMMYSDYAMEEMALAGNPPSGAVYDPERDGTILSSLGVTEHWNNPADKQYSRNLGTGEGIELVYTRVSDKP